MAREVLALAGIILALFVAWLFVVNFGRPPFEPASEPSRIIFDLYSFVVVAAGAVASIFLGAMVYFAIRFRSREGYGDGEGA